MSARGNSAPTGLQSGRRSALAAHAEARGREGLEGDGEKGEGLEGGGVVAVEAGEEEGAEGEDLDDAGEELADGEIDGGFFAAAAALPAPER